ncbi:unnamed protein product [Triticum turgidum subsp. durum]|uniref:Uncharacterized protein n=1 Tax=Triticum turgidum subsp. durum TaxID=4567 RepID=A0A9R0TUQ3_TRITD|nr:unnamed protein product [Triticum turgidum subsp. durum]
MKLVWCPETASQAFIAGVSALSDSEHGPAGSAGVAELVSAMVGGWNAQLVVDAPEASAPDSATTSLALAAAAQRTGGRYARVLADADRAMEELEGVDFLVVDARRRDAAAVLAAARPGARGMVVVRHGDGRRRGTKALEASMAAGTRIVRSVYLPIDTGVEVLHVGVGKGPSIQCRRSPRVSSRWIRHVDQETGEEHLFRRQ